MIDTQPCSSYDEVTLVEISAGFDGSEGGVKGPSLNKDYKIKVFMNASFVYHHKMPKWIRIKIGSRFTIHNSLLQKYYKNR